MHWSELLPMIVAGTIMVVVPGYLMAWVLGLRREQRLPMAPLLSVSMLGVAAVVAGQLGVAWGPLVYALMSLVMIVVVGVFVFGLRRLTHSRNQSVEGSRRDDGIPWGGDERLERRASWKRMGAGLLGVLVAAIGIVLQLKKSLINPDSVSQSYDNIFHLNAIRYIHETGNGSSLSLGGMTTPDGSPAFYPAAWHDFVSLIFDLFPGSVPASTNAATIVVAALVWPLSVLAFATSFRKMPAGFVMAATVLSGTFLAYPGLMLKWGILYPNMLGYAILPAFLAVICAVIDAIVKSTVRRSWHLALLLLMGTAGISLAHPNALSAAAVLTLPAVVSGIVVVLRRRREGGTWVRGGVLIVSALACVAIWYLVRPDEKNSTWPPSLTQGHAAGEFLTNSFNGSRSQWVISVLVVLGVVYLLRRRRHIWLAVAWALTGFLWIVVSAVEQGPYRTLMVGPWYNDSFRLAALAPATEVILAGVGLSWCLSTVGALIGARSERNATARILLVLGGVVILASGFGLTRTQALDEASASVAHEFKIKPDSLLLTADEFKVLDRVDDYVPADDAIAVNPWEGSALAYALEDRQVTSRHSLSEPLQKYKPIVEGLDNPSDKAEVCKTVRDTKTYWYLHFDDTLKIGAQYDDVYEGLDHANTSPLLKPVYTSGNVGLYKIVGCGTQK